MKKTGLLLFFLLLSSFSQALLFQAGKPQAAALDKISVEEGKFKTTIRVESRDPLALAGAFYAEDRPSTLILDFDGARMEKDPALDLDKSSLVESLRVESLEQNKIRLYLQLKNPVPYQVYGQPGTTVVELTRIQAPEEDLSPEEGVKKEIKDSPGIAYLDGFDILKGQDGLDIIARLSGKCIPQVFALKNPLRLVLDLYQTVHSQTKSSYPVSELGVKEVRSSQFQVENPFTITRVVFELEQPKRYRVSQTDKEVSISFFKDQAPLAAAEEPPKLEIPQPVEEKALQKSGHMAQEKPSPQAAKTEEAAKAEAPSAPSQFQPRILAETETKYTGELISPRFKDADLRDVILYLGDQFGFNVVFDPEVRGSVTCDFKDIPWDQFIDIILKINRLGKIIEGNVLRIAPIDALAKEQEAERRLEESKELAGPVVTKSFTLSYAKAPDLHTLLQTKKSSRGEIIFDARTNTLIVTDVKDRVELIERLIAELDTATPQVSIEARIVEATTTFVRNLGIQWGWRGIVDPFYGNQTSLQFPSKILSDGALIPQGVVTKGIGGPLGGYAVNLPAPAFSSAVGLSLSNVLDTFRIDLALSALESSGEGRIISSPTIMAQNNKEAEIIQGRQIPVQTAANFTITTRYQNAALELKATPQITADGSIIMTIEVLNNAPDFANLVQGIPPIITQSAKTTVRISDGGTTVIGGIYRTEDSITRERVPFFYKIPIIGHLFRSFSRTRQTRELLIFITPRIIK